jgi:hypothetical protein
MANDNSFSIHVPTGKLSDDQISSVLYGTGKRIYNVPLGAAVLTKLHLKGLFQI